MKRTKRQIVRFLQALLLVFLLMPAMWPEVVTAREADAPKIDLAVLYAGNPGSERMQDFEIFLSQHFRRVATADYENFVPHDAHEFDVVIFDWTSIYPRDEAGKIVWSEEANIAQPTPPKLDRSFTRPSVLIGAAAGTLANQLQTAINWKCLCLENVAHDVATGHPIFQGPRPVTMECEEKEKPLDYYLAPGTDSLGEKLPVWKVQEKNFPEIDPGLVSSRENFTGTPDAEVISGGFNGKGPTSVAIGRHGNFLLWGFSAQASDMTESARNAFVNAVCYIEKFDGQAAGPVTLAHGGRESFLERIYYLRSVTDEYIDRQVEVYKRMIRENPPTEAQLQQIGDDPAAFFRKMYEPHAQAVLDKLPAEVRQACSDNAEKLIRYYRNNIEYLRTDGKGGFELDQDVQQIGISNRSPALLEKCIASLEADEDAELAQRVLARYTEQQFDTAAEWRQWLAARGEKLRLDDSTGRFID